MGEGDDTLETNKKYVFTRSVANLRMERIASISIDLSELICPGIHCN